MSLLFQFPEICITEASAGSGKTYALAKRYVQLLLQTAGKNPQSYKSILAITFTNKASQQMKARVLSLLKKIALSKLHPQEEKEFLAPLGLKSSEASAIAYDLMETLIHHYHFFSIKTIDSFINTLLAGCAFKINLSARFKIQRNSTDYLEQSLDQWIALSHHDVAVRKLLDDFVHQYLFLENRSGWFPKEDLLDILKILFSEFNTYQKPFLTFPIDGRDMYLAKKRFLGHVEQIPQLADPSMNKKFIDGLSQFLLEHPVSFDLDELSRYFSYPEFPANKGSEVSSALETLWGKVHEEAKDLCLAESYGVFNPYVMIFNKVGQVFSELCSREDILFLEELNKKASSLIEGGVSVTELYYRLAARFNHYLIDEFQDTSLSQWQNLSSMVQEALSSGGSLFLVGDKKQAIYSFRGGESKLFDQLPLQLSNAPLRRDYLKKNWRSHKVIVEFNNQLFSHTNISEFLVRRKNHYAQKKASDEVFFTEDDIKALEETFAHSHQEIRDDMTEGYVQVRHIDGKRKQERLEATKQHLVETITELKARFSLKDIAILTRNNGQVQQVTQWLLNQGIYAQSDRTSDLKNHGLIIELVDLLRFLNSPHDNVSFARFLLGDICSYASGLSPEELQNFLFECRKRKDVIKENYLYKAFRERYPEIWRHYFEDFFSQVGIYPVYELVVSIYARFRVQELHEAQGFFMHFLELIKRREEYSCDVESFIQYFDQLDNEERFVPMPVQDAVQVMTIHKAKGLQFPVVIVPFLEMTVQTTKGSQSAFSYVLDVREEGLRMLRLKKTYGRFSELLKERFEKEYKDSFAVEFNNVYVALTRAVDELYIMIPERTGNSTNPVQFLFPEILFSKGQKVMGRKLAQLPPQIPLLNAAFDHQWVSHLKEEFEEEGPSQAYQRLQGSIIHYVLAQIPRIQADILQVLLSSLRTAKSRFGLAVDTEALSVLISQFLKRPEVKRFFEFELEVQVYCEQEVVNRFGDSKRIDRLIVFKDKVWVIDFKTSHSQEAAHQKQIEEYKMLVAQLYPKHQVEGFLVYL